MDLIVLDNDDVHDIEAGFGCKALMGSEEKEKLFVAVGKEVKHSESVLFWAIQNSGGRLISLIHVHHPDDFIPILGKKYHWSSLEEHQVKTYRGIERQLMLRALDEYQNICRQFGVQTEKLYVETDNVEKGLLQFISQYNVVKLVMGAATDDTYHPRMVGPKSKKAIYLQLHAPASCHIWFVCKGHLVHQREASPQGRVCVENKSSTDLQYPSAMAQCNKSDVSHHEPLLIEDDSRFGVTDYGKHTKFPLVDNNRQIVPVSQTQLDMAAIGHDWGESLGFRSQGSDDSTESSSRMNRELASDPLDPFAGSYEHSYSSPSLSQEKYPEGSHVEELRKRKQVEEDLELVKKDRDRLREDLRVFMDQNLVLESKVANYDEVMKDLEAGIFSHVEQLEICEKERDDLKRERDNVLRTAEELLNQSAESASRTEVKLFAALTFDEIEKITCDFDPSLQLWEGESGSIYKGFLSHTQVTVRIWHPEGLQGPREFHQEVEILSKLRHPNLISLMGVCPEAWALVYEYLPYGSLEKRLHCEDHTPPLSWQTRIKIATDLCSALIFLHSRKPLKVVHGALRPSSIFLDSNFTCKIGDFGFSYLISHDENFLSSAPSSSSPASPYTDPTVDAYLGEITPLADVYSFGTILLELLTGKTVSELENELQEALDEHQLNSVLDTSAGVWPYVQAEQLAQLGLRCCEEDPTYRPDLESIWRVLEPMRASCAGLSSPHLGDEEHRQAPSYFICPIFQEVMKDPHVAADGYTYEAEALRGWLETGHNTSPMTNLVLSKSDLVPNHALRSAIQEWRENH